MAAEDRLDKEPSSPGMPALKASGTAGLPTEEPGQNAAPQQRDSLLKNIAKLEETFQYLGTAHPQYEQTKRRLEQMRALLKKVDESAAG